MTGRDAFVRRICEEPWEDTHRLVFADYLEENGESLRAELIRLQCRDIPSSVVCGHIERKAFPLCDHCRFRDREQQLLTSEEAVGWRRLPWGAVARDGFARGFITSIRPDEDAFLKHAGDVFRTHPVVAATLAGRRPARAGPEPVPPESRYSWLSRRNPAPDRPYYELAWELFDRLGARKREGDFSYRGEFWFAEYASYDAAEEDLSRACIAYGRELVGLPPLEIPKEVGV